MFWKLSSYNEYNGSDSKIWNFRKFFKIILCPLLFCDQMIQERFFKYLILSCIFYADIWI